MRSRQRQNSLASKGKKETVKLLISLGANPTLTDKSGKSPQALASDAGHKTIVPLLQQAEYAYDAIQEAKAVFYISEDDLIKRQAFLRNLSEIYHAYHKKIERSLINRGETVRILLLCLIEIKSYLEVAKDSNYHIGLCGELIRACLANLLSVEPKLSIAKFRYYDSSHPRANHTFIAISLGEPADIYNPSTWSKDTLICDPSAKAEDRLYFLDYAPLTNAIREMKSVDTTELQFRISESIISELTSRSPSLAIEVSTLIQHNRNLLSALQPVKNRFNSKI